MREEGNDQKEQTFYNFFFFMGREERAETTMVVTLRDMKRFVIYE